MYIVYITQVLKFNVYCDDCNYMNSLYTGASDWTWWHDNVPTLLKELHDDGTQVMFFTNQAGIEKGKMKPQEIMRKIEDIIDKLDIPILVCTASSINLYYYLTI